MGLEKLRLVISVDRDAAGEARGSARRHPLATVAYSKPLRIRWKRRWRRDLRLRQRVWGSAVVTVMLIAVWLLSPWTAGAKSASRAHTRAEATAMRASAAAHPNAAEHPNTALVAAQAGVAVGMTPSPSEPTGLSARRRVQRAELWLRIGSARGDREARALLESALREVPGDAHAQAVLAEACLRLGDADCARSAVGVARAVRPWRGGYRSLSRRIEASFSAPLRR